MGDIEHSRFVEALQPCVDGGCQAVALRGELRRADLRAVEQAGRADRAEQQLRGAVEALELLRDGLDGTGDLPFGARLTLHGAARMALKRAGGGRHGPYVAQA